MIVPVYLPRLGSADCEGITVLAADIGGTKTSIGLYKSAHEQLHLLQEDTYPSQTYSSFTKVMKKFLHEKQLPVPDRLSIGVAGPVIDGKVTMTNLSWKLDRHLLLQETGVKEVALLNDLEATAYGLAGLAENDLGTIYSGNSESRGNIAILAPGTGLGEAAMFWDGSAYRPFATEGGHSYFSPVHHPDMALYEYLQKQHDVVSWERVISGPGIYSLYRFLCDTKAYQEPAWLTEKFQSSDPAAVISQAAIEELDPVCAETMKLFITYMARESTNLVLKLKATGGLLLGGGIPPKIHSLLKNDLFFRQFVQCDRMEHLLKGIPIRLILNDKAALLGAAYFGAYGEPEIYAGTKTAR